MLFQQNCIQCHGVDGRGDGPEAANLNPPPTDFRLHIPVHTDPRLAERRLSPEPIERWRDVVHRSFSDLDHRAPGGESGREALARGWAAIRSALDRPCALPALVSHGQLLSLVLHSIDASFGFAGWEGLRNPDVLILESLPSGSHTFARL